MGENQETKVDRKGKQRDLNPPSPSSSPSPSPSLSPSSSTADQTPSLAQRSTMGRHQRNLSFPLDSYSPTHSEPPLVGGGFGFVSLSFPTFAFASASTRPSSFATPPPSSFATPAALAGQPESSSQKDGHERPLDFQPQPQVQIHEKNEKKASAVPRPLPKVPPPSPPPATATSSFATSSSSSASNGAAAILDAQVRDRGPQSKLPSAAALPLPGPGPVSGVVPLSGPVSSVVPFLPPPQAHGGHTPIRAPYIPPSMNAGSSGGRGGHPSPFNTPGPSRHRHAPVPRSLPPYMRQELFNLALMFLSTQSGAAENCDIGLQRVDISGMSLPAPSTSLGGDFLFGCHSAPHQPPNNANASIPALCGTDYHLISFAAHVRRLSSPQSQQGRNTALASAFADALEQYILREAVRTRMFAEDWEEGLGDSN
ncbi:hypothetical protein NMY22_g10776 [Coprinellus aureogranulatus]|nr:hypothetical protein NMY22_g10776 [Coprinellus aureogranulatus]